MTSTSKFFALRVGDVFYLNTTPKKRVPSDPDPKLQVALCMKAGPTVYTNAKMESVLGEISFTPDIDAKLITQAEYAELTSPKAAPIPVKLRVTVKKKSPAKKTKLAAKKMVGNAAKLVEKRAAKRSI